MDIVLTITGDAAEKLRAEAERQQVAPTKLAQDVIETFLDDLDEEIEDTPDDEILADLRAALEDVKAGRTRPIEDLFAELDDEIEDTPDETILANIRAALEDVKAGRTSPAHEVLAEIRAELIAESE